jgi:putative tryptophan/tyrosine transport system substrate-binding protein
VKKNNRDEEIGNNKRPNVLDFVLCVIIFAVCSPAAAQQTGKVHRIGLLITGSQSTYSARIDAFRMGLRELRYIEGQNTIIEYRYSEGQTNRLSDLAADLVRLKVAVIVTGTRPAIFAAQGASSAIPIVFTGLGRDPVADGLVSSLAKPGGNITGLTMFFTELNAKRIQLLKEAFPKVMRVAYFLNRANSTEDETFSYAEAVVKTLGIRLQSVDVKSADDFESAFEAAKRAGAQALTFTADPFFVTHRDRILNLAVKNKQPAIYPYTDFVEAGGLMSYAPDINENWRRAAGFVDKILNGAKPGDLPIEQPKKFELIINLKAAKQIGVTIPPNVLARADRVIR